MIVVLVGYMGGGKSSVGIELSRVLSYKFIDLDTYIEEREGLIIPRIFKEKGEIKFRTLETLYLKEILSSKDDIVLSLGGGTPCYGNNMELISDKFNTISIYLKTSITELTNRLFRNKISRPLIGHLESKEKLAEFIGKHLFERSAFYSQSDHTIISDSKTIKTIIEEILMKLI